MTRYGRRQRRRGRQTKSRVNFTLIAGIILIAVLAGYVTTRFVIYPFLLQEKPPLLSEKQEEQKQEQTEGQSQDKNGVLSDGLDVKNVDESASSGGAVKHTDGMPTQAAADGGKEVTPASGYCIQFGSFTTKAAAEKLISELALSGVTAKIFEKDGAFKVIGDLFPEKEQAAQALQALDQALYEGVFITTI